MFGSPDLYSGKNLNIIHINPSAKVNFRLGKFAGVYDISQVIFCLIFRYRRFSGDLAFISRQTQAKPGAALQTLL